MFNEDSLVINAQLIEKRKELTHKENRTTLSLTHTITVYYKVTKTHALTNNKADQNIFELKIKHYL